MLHILLEFWRGLQRWERPARLALKLGLLALVPLLLLWLAGPASLQRPALAGLCGLGLGLQMVFLWAWRGMLSDWSKAQRLYLDGEFEAACDLLQARRTEGRADMRSLTLLGNALRMRALLEQSEAVLREAQLEMPGHAFPLTGLGRTLLAQGRYAEAADTLEAAIERGAPDVVALDLGEARYHSGNIGAAIAQLQTGMNATRDSGRRLIAQLLLQQAGASTGPDETLLQDGLPWLKAQAERYAGTDYGRILQSMLRIQVVDRKL
ncbi:MAG: tetratricopeptide repeat protein [Anaerolineae bacterium]|nr:tetratricopeptide repeat protein [Anaerolineae bacterium]